MPVIVITSSPCCCYAYDTWIMRVSFHFILFFLKRKVKVEKMVGRLKKIIWLCTFRRCISKLLEQFIGVTILLAQRSFVARDDIGLLCAVFYNFLLITSHACLFVDVIFVIKNYLIRKYWSNLFPEKSDDVWVLSIRCWYGPENLY